MSHELRELYQEVIIDHGSKPRHFNALENPTCIGHGHNPLCGDNITLYVKLKNEMIEDLSFQGNGCAISMASASLMCDHLQNKNLDTAQQIFQLFHSLLTDNGEIVPELGKLAVLSGVREFPARVKCATLAWHTLQNALAHNQTPVTTE